MKRRSREEGEKIIKQTLYPERPISGKTHMHMHMMHDLVTVFLFTCSPWKEST